MVTMPWWALALIIAAFVVVLLAVVASATATRLNRLHIRTDLARASLAAALGRRAAVARATYPQLVSLVAAAEATEYSARQMALRADAENEVTRALVRLVEQEPPSRQFAIELHDAHTRLELARRFYNDAVTDTVALRRRPLVRLLYLSGTAPEPQYFDMADAPALPISGGSAGSNSSTE